MKPLIQRLLGNGVDERLLTEEVRAVLVEMQQERVRYDKLIQSSQGSIDQLQRLSDPIARATTEVDSVAERLASLEHRFKAMEKLPWMLDTLEERAKALEEGQQETESKVTGTLEEAQEIRSQLKEFNDKVDTAEDLKSQLDSFLEIDKPFQQLRGEADDIRSHVEGTGEHLAKLREQHERLMDAHKLGTAKMEALDRRREELGRDMQDKERRVVDVERALNKMDGVRETVDGINREIGTLKALGDSVAQKTAELEAQREAVEQALVRADNLNQAMRQIDAGVLQQEENEKLLGSLQDQVATLKNLHDSVLERSTEINELQRKIDEQTQQSRQELAAVSDEMKNTVNRFEFEGRGLESVTQRVTDLRDALTGFEARFEGLSKSSLSVHELDSRTQKASTQMQNLSSQLERTDEEAAKLQTVRRDLNETMQKAGDLAGKVDHIEESRPAIEVALQDLEQLSSAHATVKDAREQTLLVHGEISRMRENHSETRSWLEGVEKLLAELEDKVATLRQMTPTIDSVQTKAQHVSESMTAIETRREVVEDVQRRLAELESLSGSLDERGQGLHERMETAEQQFTALALQGQEAERITNTIADVTTSVEKADQTANEVQKLVADIEERCESVDALADRTRTLKAELDQRQHALKEAGADLQRASELRQEAAEATQQLAELSKKLGSSLKSADRRAEKVDTISKELEGRVETLAGVETRLNEFDGRLTKWEQMDQEISRTLEQISARQGTIESLKADIERMFVTAEKTSENVRAITAANRDVEEGRKLLEDVMGRLREVRNTASAIDDRKRQLNRSEERLARADALLVDVTTGLTTLQGQKVIVEQAVEKAGSLRFLLKQAEGMIEGLRDERKMTTEVQAAVEDFEEHEESDEGPDEEAAGPKLVEVA